MEAVSGLLKVELVAFTCGKFRLLLSLEITKYSYKKQLNKAMKVALQSP